MFLKPTSRNGIGVSVQLRFGSLGAPKAAMSLKISLRCSVFFSLPSLALVGATALPAQSLMGGTGPSGLVRIFNTDSAILEAQEPRKDLPCTANQIKPQLGFDM